MLQNNVIKSLATKVEFNCLNLAAGGTGITPFVRLLNYYCGRELDINLIYCNSSVAEIALKPVLDRLARANPRLRVTYLVDRLEAECAGALESRVNERIVAASFANSDSALCLFCGPPGFNDALYDILHKLEFKHVHRV